MALRNPDFTTAKRIAAAINDFIGVPTAEPTRSVHRRHHRAGPISRQHGVSFSPKSSNCRSSPTRPARIVIDERSGIIVMGRDVRVSMVAVAQGNLTVTISETPQVSQPAPFARRGRDHCGAAHQYRRAGRRKEKFARGSEGVSLQQLVDGLNALGIGPRDLITILQAIKAAGAIQADIEVM